MSIATAQLSAAGVSLWLDDLSRPLLNSGVLTELVKQHNVVGVTTNPAIFAAAIGDTASYSADIIALKKQGFNAQQIAFELATQDVRAACDILRSVYESTNRGDGYVSLEVDPALCHDSAATVAQAKEMWHKVNRPNLMIKIPATSAGLIAVAELLAQGINVNITLIFSLTRCREVLNAYFVGLERAHSAGFDLSKIHAVASLFISRLDSAVAAELSTAHIASEVSAATPQNTLATDMPQQTMQHTASLSQLAGLANARLAVDTCEQQHNTARAELLLAAGANKLRLLWASTGVKDTQLPAIYYAQQLVAADTVNTLPLNTLKHLIAEQQYSNGELLNRARATEILDAIAERGVDYQLLTAKLETQGLEKFMQAWQQLLLQIENT